MHKRKYEDEEREGWCERWSITICKSNPYKPCTPLKCDPIDPDTNTTPLSPTKQAQTTALKRRHSTTWVA